MKKYLPVPLTKHWLTSKPDKKHYEFSSESSIAIFLGPFSLLHINPWLMLVLTFIDVLAVVMLVFVISQKFISLILIVTALILLFANHYLSAWLRSWLLERRK